MYQGYLFECLGRLVFSFKWFIATFKNPGLFADKSGLSSPMHCLVFEILFMAIHPKAGGNVDKKKF